MRGNFCTNKRILAVLLSKFTMMVVMIVVMMVVRMLVMMVVMAMVMVVVAFPLLENQMVWREGQI